MKKVNSEWKGKVTSLQDLVNNWTDYLVEGELRPRERLLEMCKECGGETYHRLGCEFEKSSCEKHLFSVQCDCEIRLGEPV